jgi:hypothetical protein
MVAYEEAIRTSDVRQIHGLSEVVPWLISPNRRQKTTWGEDDFIAYLGKSSAQELIERIMEYSDESEEIWLDGSKALLKAAGSGLMGNQVGFFRNFAKVFSSPFRQRALVKKIAGSDPRLADLMKIWEADLKWYYDESAERLYVYRHVVNPNFDTTF